MIGGGATPITDTTVVEGENGSGGGGDGARLNRSTDDAVSILHPPNSFHNADVQMLKWTGICQLLGSIIWLVCLMGLYLSVNGFSPRTELFEARWLPATLAVNGALCLLFCKCKNQASFIATGCGCLVAGPASLIALVVYLVNSVKGYRSFFVLDHQEDTYYVASGRKAYIEICVSLTFVCFTGVVLVSAELLKLYRLADWHYGDCTASLKCRQNLQMTSGGQVGLALFSVYVTSQMMTVQLTYIRSYLVQELFCAALLLAVSLLQTCTIRRFNRVLVVVLALGNTMQFVQELTYAWTAYYVSVYLHSASVAPAQGFAYDQVIMTFNFVAHTVRMCLCAFSAYLLMKIIGVRVLTVPLQVDLSRDAYFAVAALATGLMAVGTCHVVLDIIYMGMRHIYRQILATTGVSVFYANLAGVSLSMFIRYRRNFFLLPTTIFCLSLISTSLHAIYIYCETSFTMYHVEKLDAMDRDKLRPTLMHFSEALVAFVGLLLAGAVTTLCLRLLRLESRHERHAPIGVLRCLRRGAVALSVTTILELACVIRLKTKWQLNDVASNYGLLDGLSMIINCLLLFYVCRQSAVHLRYPLLVVFLHLLGETLASLNYIQSQSTYVQALVMVSKASDVAKRGLNNLFPMDEMATVFLAHVLQVVQWVIVIVCLLAAGFSLELISIGDNEHQLAVVDRRNGFHYHHTADGSDTPRPNGRTTATASSVTTCTYSNPAYSSDAQSAILIDGDEGDGGQRHVRAGSSEPLNSTEAGENR